MKFELYILCLGAVENGDTAQGLKNQRVPAER